MKTFKKIIFFKKYFLVIFLLVFLYSISRIYLRKTSSFGCFDDCFNYTAGWLILKNKILYKDIFFNHQPLAAYLSALIQAISHPKTIYELLLAHRNFLIAFSFIWNILIFKRFNFIGLVFILCYESIKYYIFGDRFLAEGIIVYPLVYLMGICLDGIRLKKISIIDVIVAPILSWFVIFMREPYAPLSFWLYIVIVFLYRNKDRILFSSLFIFLILSIGIFIFFPITDYLYNVFYINLNSILIENIANDKLIIIKILRIIGYPIDIFLEGKITFLRLHMIILSSIYIYTICLLFNKNNKFIFFSIFTFALANLRPVLPGTMFYEAFHMIPWYGIFLFSTSYFTFVLLSENKKKVVPIFIGFILLFLHVFSPKSFIYEKTDRSYEYQINYGNYLVQADIIKTLSISSDSVFLDGWDEIIYIQSDRIPKYKYGWYTSMMPHFLKYSEERIKMFKLSPPEIYYGNCYFGGKLPKFVIDDYVPFIFLINKHVFISREANS